MAVTVRSVFIATVQVVPATESQPLQEEKVLPLGAVAGAVRVTLVPWLYTRLKGVEPFPCPLISTGLRVMDTPLEGLVELTVSVRGGVT